MTKCPGCRQPMPATTTRGKPRKFCSRECAGRASAAAKVAQRAALIEDFEWMLANGDSPAQIVLRLGTNPEALERRLHRAGRPDLAAYLNPLNVAARRHPCADCGRLVDRGSRRCRKCAPATRNAELAGHNVSRAS